MKLNVIFQESEKEISLSFKNLSENISVEFEDTHIVNEPPKETLDLLNVLLSRSGNINSEIPTEVGKYAFAYGEFESANLPNLESAGERTFYSCKELLSVKLPKVTELPTYMFYTCSKLLFLELGKIESVGSNSFASVNLLSAVVLRNEEETSTTNLSKFPTSIRTKGGTNNAEQGYVYVPRSLIESYQSNNPNFRFRAIEDYPEISIYRWKRFTPANSYVFNGWDTYEAYYNGRETDSVSVYRDFQVNTSGDVVGVGSYSSMTLVNIANTVNNGGNLYYRYSSTDVRKIVRVEDMGSSAYYRYRMYYVSGNVKAEKDWTNLGSETIVVSSDPEYFPDKGNDGTYYYEKLDEVKIKV